MNLNLYPTKGELDAYLEWMVATKTSLDSKCASPISRLKFDPTFVQQIDDVLQNLPTKLDEIRYEAVWCTRMPVAQIAYELKQVAFAAFLKLFVINDPDRDQVSSLFTFDLFVNFSTQFHDDLTTLEKILKILKSRNLVGHDDVKKYFQEVSKTIDDIKLMTSSIAKSVHNVPDHKKLATSRLALDLLVTVTTVLRTANVLSTVLQKVGFAVDGMWVSRIPNLVEEVFQVFDMETLIKIASYLPFHSLKTVLKEKSKISQYSAKIFVEKTSQLKLSQIPSELFLGIIADVGLAERWLSTRTDLQNARVSLENGVRVLQEATLKVLQSSKLGQNLGKPENDVTMTLISDVQAILPHLSSEYVHLCLRHFAYDTEVTLAALLSKELPLELRRLEVVDWTAYAPSTNIDLTPPVDDVIDDVELLLKRAVSERQKPEVKKEEPEEKKNAFKGLFSLALPTASSSPTTSSKNAEATVDDSYKKLIDQVLESLNNLVVEERMEEGEVVGINGDRLVPMTTSKNFSAVNSLKLTKEDEIAIRPTYEAYRYEKNEDGEDIYDDEYDDAYEQKEFTIEPLNEPLSSTSEDEDEPPESQPGQQQNTSARGGYRGRGRGGRGRGGGAPPEAQGQESDAGRGRRQTTYTGGRERQNKERNKGNFKQRGADKKMRGAY